MFGPTKVFRLTVEAFSFRFKCLFRGLRSPVEHGTSGRYSIAVLDEVVQYHASSNPPYQSRFLRPQSNVPLWPGLGKNKYGRSVGGGRASKLAGCGPLVGACVIRTAGWRKLRPILSSKNERCPPKAKIAHSNSAGARGRWLNSPG